MRPVHVFVVQLRPGLAALSGVVAVLHARAADISGMSYTVRGAVASLSLESRIAAADADRLVLQLDRRVDVLDVAVRSSL
ncbi:MAG: hypothetical protein NVS3B26_28060 [Mycobacteriales bacterium]